VSGSESVNEFLDMSEWSDVGFQWCKKCNGWEFPKQFEILKKLFPIFTFEQILNGGVRVSRLTDQVWTKAIYMLKDQTCILSCCKLTIKQSNYSHLKNKKRLNPIKI